MDYEKLYKEALERAKKELKECGSPDWYSAKQICRIFPELHESEDERIRRKFIEALKGCGFTHFDNDFTIQEAIAWLEKQSEQKITNSKEDTDFTIYYPLKNGNGKYECIPYSFYGSLTSFSDNEDLIDFLHNCFYTKQKCEDWIKKQGELKYSYNTKPKFKVGDWITNGVGNTCYIKGIFENHYELCSNDGFEYTKHIKDVDNYFQLWTIKDAKDGDVLYCKKRILDNSEIIMMYAGISNNIDSYCRYSSKSGFNTYITDVLNVEHDFIIPATKEQHDFLFQKMVEVGYKWDSNKKELIRM